MPFPARPVGGFTAPIRLLVLLLGLLVPLHLPFTLPVSAADKTLGWWSRGHGAGAEGMVVTQTTWHARAAGLVPGDLVLRVDGRAASEAEVERVLDAKAVGDSVRLTVRRGGRTAPVWVGVAGSSVSTTGYWWFRVLLALAAGVVGLVLVAWQGRRPAPLALGAALVLVGPVIVTVHIPGGHPAMQLANAIWQTQGAGYRFLFPLLLAHFLVLQRPAAGPRILRSGVVWVPAYLLAALALAGSTAGFGDPLAWAVAGPARMLRTSAGLAAEAFALVVAVLVLRTATRAPGPRRWLTQSIVVCLGVGLAISLLFLESGESTTTVDSLRQLKSVAVLLVVATSAIYALSLADGEVSGWHLRGRLSTAAAAVLTVVFGFAVASAAAVVHAYESTPSEVEILLFLTIFVTAIGFSPVLRWAREMVDRQVLARRVEMDLRTGAFADRLSAELEPGRIAERIAAETPPVVGVAAAELVLSRELTEGWVLRHDERPLSTARAAELDREQAEGGNGRFAVPIRRPAGELIGLLRVTPRPDAPELDAPERAALATLARGVASALRITEAYLRLRHAESDLARAERTASMGALAAGLAHEIKNPLMGVKLGLHLLGRDGAHAERLGRLSGDVRRIDDLVTGLLRFTSDELPDETDRLDVADAVRECVLALRPTAEDRGTRIVERYPGRSAIVNGGRMQLRLVVSNLLKNAIDAVSEGGRVEVSVEAAAGGVLVRIGDDGPGICPSLRQRIFELAFSTKPGGSGIGLALARRETERMGGSIEAEARSGRGTVMVVRLPHPSAAGHAAPLSDAETPPRMDTHA